MTYYLKTNLFWLMITEISVHYGGEDEAEKSSSHPGLQEVEKEISGRGQGKI
jgi:hypothetical protein